MKNIFKTITFLSLILVLCFGLVACDSTKSDKENNNSNSKTVAENVELGKATLGDVEFENAETVKIKKEGTTYTISGTITAMSKSQKIAYGVQDVTHVVALKFTFDDEKTISSFEIKGNTTKVYSVDKNTDNYVGSISDLLDSEDGEDAFCYLVLSANTQNYKLKSTYSDNTTSEINLKITATLATADAD